MKDEILEAMRDQASKIEQAAEQRRIELKEQAEAKMLADSKSLIETEAFVHASYSYIEEIGKEIQSMYGDYCDVFFNEKPETLKKKHNNEKGKGIRIVTKEAERMGDRASTYFWISPGTSGVLCESKKLGPNLKPEFAVLKPAGQFLKNRLKGWAVETVVYFQTAIERTKSVSSIVGQNSALQ